MDISSSSSSSNGAEGRTAADDESSDRKRKFASMDREALLNALVGYEVIIEKHETKIDLLSKRNAVEDAVQVAYYVGKIAGKKIKEQATKEVAEYSKDGIVFTDLQNFTLEGQLASEVDNCQILVHFTLGVMAGCRDPTGQKTKEFSREK
jgi:hypothetical protein